MMAAAEQCGDSGTSDELVAHYERDGVVVVRGALTSEQVYELREVVDRIRTQPDRRTRLHSRQRQRLLTGSAPLFTAEPIDEGEYWLHFNAFLREPAVVRIATDSLLPALAARLFGTASVHFYDDLVTVKEPGTTDRTEWHHDLPQLGVGEHATICGMWCALDPCGPETGSLVYARGSHRSWRSLLAADGRLDDEAINRLEDIHSLVSFSLSPGDVVVHHHLTVHGAGPNTSSTERRRAITIRFAAPGTRVVGKPSRRLDERTQPDGEVLDPHLFPLITV